MTFYRKKNWIFARKPSHKVEVPLNKVYDFASILSYLGENKLF